MIAGCKSLPIITARACPAVVGPGTLWVQISALPPTRPDTYPLGCRRARIPTGSSLTS